MRSNSVVWFEGPDNVGKTTFIQAVSEYLSNKNITNEIVKQPGSSEFGEFIYGLHHDYKKFKYLSNFSRQLMHVAAHCQYYEEQLDRIKNSNLPQVLMSDRSLASTVAYTYAFTDKNEVERDRDAQIVFEVESLKIPTRLKPNLIVYFVNPPFEQTIEELENREKILIGYKHAFTQMKIQENLGAKLLHMRLKKGDIKESVEIFFETLKSL